MSTVSRNGVVALCATFVPRCATETKFSYTNFFVFFLCSFKRAYNHGQLYFSQILMKSAVFCCRNPLFGTKICPGSGTEFKDLLTSLVVYTQEGR